MHFFLAMCVKNSVGQEMWDKWVQRTLVMYALRYDHESELPFFPLHATIMDIEIMLMSGDGMCNSVSVETFPDTFFYAVST